VPASRVSRELTGPSPVRSPRAAMQCLERARRGPRSARPAAGHDRGPGISQSTGPPSRRTPRAVAEKAYGIWGPPLAGPPLPPPTPSGDRDRDRAPPPPTFRYARSASRRLSSPRFARRRSSQPRLGFPAAVILDLLRSGGTDANQDPRTVAIVPMTDVSRRDVANGRRVGPGRRVSGGARTARRGRPCRQVQRTYVQRRRCRRRCRVRPRALTSDREYASSRRVDA
jgi:hypothetical protein